MVGRSEDHIDIVVQKTVGADTKISFQTDNVKRIQKQIKISATLVETTDFRMTSKVKRIPFFDSNTR